MVDCGDHSALMLAGLDRLRQSGLLLDTLLWAEGSSFQVRRGCGGLLAILGRPCVCRECQAGSAFYILKHRYQSCMQIALAPLSGHQKEERFSAIKYERVEKLIFTANNQNSLRPGSHFQIKLHDTQIPFRFCTNSRFKISSSQIELIKSLILMEILCYVVHEMCALKTVSNCFVFINISCFLVGM